MEKGSQVEENQKERKEREGSWAENKYNTYKVLVESERGDEEKGIKRGQGEVLSSFFCLSFSVLLIQFCLFLSESLCLS